MRGVALLLVAVVAASAASAAGTAASTRSAGRRHFTIPLPGGERQKFALVTMRGTLRHGVGRPRVRLRSTNAPQLPEDIRGGGAVRKRIVMRGKTTIRVIVAVNNLAPRQGAQGAAEDGLGIDVVYDPSQWRFRPRFAIDVDDCPDEYDEEAEQAVALFVYFALGPWVSPAWKIIHFSIQDALRNNPSCA